MNETITFKKLYIYIYKSNYWENLDIKILENCKSKLKKIYGLGKISSKA